MLGSVAFVVIGAAVVRDHPLLGWLVMVFSALTGVVVTLALSSGKAILRLDPEGVEVVGLLTRSRYRWKEIERPNIGKMRNVRVIAIIFNCQGARAVQRRSASVALFGMDASVSDIYSVSLEELCDVMNKWWSRYGSTI